MNMHCDFLCLTLLFSAHELEGMQGVQGYVILDKAGVPIQSSFEVQVAFLSPRKY